MIHRITIENFYSIKDEISLNFKVPKNAPELSAFYTSVNKDRYPKVIGVFGHNASGKTNIVKALAFLKYFILGSYKLGKSENIPVSSFSFCKQEEDSPITFSIDFEAYGEVYEYKLQLTKALVIYEELRIKNTRAPIFKRNGKSIKSSDKSIRKFTDVVSEKSSFLSFCFHNDIDIESLRNPLKALANTYANVTSMGRDNITSSLIDKVFEATDNHFKNKTIKDKAVSLLSQFDLGLSDIKLEKAEVINDGEATQKELPFVYHSVNNSQHKLFIGQESNGTQSLYILILNLLQTLKVGGVSVIDEIDAYLHSHMLKTVLDLFYDDETNPNGAQLIFTGHADYIMNFLEKEQILIVEKDENCVTDAYLLKNVKGVRRDDNIREKYHAGAYGGIPVDNF